MRSLEWILVQHEWCLHKERSPGSRLIRRGAQDVDSYVRRDDRVKTQGEGASCIPRKGVSGGTSVCCSSHPVGGAVLQWSSKQRGCLSSPPEVPSAPLWSLPAPNIPREQLTRFLSQTSFPQHHYVVCVSSSVPFFPKR